MSDDWKPGDLALCVAVTLPGYGPSRILRKGALYTVSDTYMGLPKGRTERVLALVLAEVRSLSPPGGFHHAVFRKIKPLTDDEREEFVADLNVREPANA